MIKVNLLKNRGAAAADNATQLDFEMTVKSPAGEGGPASETLVKILVVLLPVIMLWGYETYNVGELTTKSEANTQKLNDLTTEINKNKLSVDKAKQMQTEIKELEERVTLIKNLSKVRLREIKAIDYLQNVIPDKVWFSDLKFKDTVFQAQGYSVSDEALNKFIEGLEGKSFFRNVILMQSMDQKTKTGTIKNFTFSSTLTATD